MPLPRTRRQDLDQGASESTVLAVKPGADLIEPDCKGTGSLELVIADHLLPHEERPYGMPESWDWVTTPVTHSGTNPGGFAAMTFWGQVFEGASGNPATNTRVHIRDARAYMLSRRDRQWHLLQSDVEVEVEGGMFDFVAGTQTDADIRAEPEGGISITAEGRACFHFWGHWPKSRVPIQPDDIAGVFTTVQARLVLDEPTGPDDGRPASSGLIHLSGIRSNRVARRCAAAGPASQYDHSTTCHQK